MKRILLALVGLLAASLPASAQTTWSTLNANCPTASFTLTLGNLKATNTATGLCRGTTSHTAADGTGKFYYEITLNTNSAGSQWSIGVATASALTNNYVGSSTQSAGYLAGITTARINGASIGTLTSGCGFATHICGVAIDIGAQLIWFRDCSGGTCGNFNTSAVAGPLGATGGPGFPLATLAGFTLFPAWSDNTNPDAVTANFAGPFTNTPAAPFPAWDSGTTGGSAPRMPALGVGQNDEPANDNIRYARAAGE